MSKEHREPESNIDYLCKDCTSKAYPNKGKFTRQQIERARYVKTRFENTKGQGELMWVKISKVTDTQVEGKVSNIATKPSMPSLGDPVVVDFKDVYELFN